MEGGGDGFVEDAHFGGGGGGRWVGGCEGDGVNGGIVDVRHRIQ